MRIQNAMTGCAATVMVLATTGCASTYGGMASANNLGAAEYRPAVLVPPGKEQAYSQILLACREASFNRQVTAASKGQEGSLVSAVQGAAAGASGGYKVSSLFKSAGFDSSTTKGTLAGAGFGVLSSVAGSFGRGASDTSDAVRATLLACLRSQEVKYGYTVLE